jgi:TolB-like protein/DNA-binding SARP family transcriptional activator
MRYSLDLFGGFALRGQDLTALDVRLSKCRAILAFLALAPRGEASRDDLVAILWSDRAERQADQSLRQALLALKRDLERGGIAGLKIKRHRVSLDLEHFEISALAVRELAGSDPQPTKDAAIALPEGEFLQGLMIRDPVGKAWIADRVAEFDQLRLKFMEAALQAALAEEDLEGIETIARRILAIAPAARCAHRALIAALLARGERRLAVQQWQQQRKSAESADASSGLNGIRDIVLVDEAPRKKNARRSHCCPTLRPGLLVMPFKCEDGSARTTRLARGLVDDLVVDLSRLSLLAILPPGTTTSLGMDAVGGPVAARHLGVEYCLGGSVETRSHGDNSQFRFSATLTDARSGQVLWAQRYELPDHDIWRVRNDVAGRIASTATHAADVAEMERVRAVGTRNRDAWTLRVLAQQSFLRYTRAANTRARTLFAQAVAIDPQFARAEVGIGWTHLEDFCFGWSAHPSASLDAAEQSANRALVRDHEFYSATHLLSYVALCRRDYERAADTCAQAREDNPNDPDLLLHEGYVTSCAGAPARGVDIMLEAFAINPVHPAWYHLLAGNGALDAGRIRTAIAELTRFIDMQRGPVVGVKAQALRTRAAAYSMNGDMDQAIVDRDVYMAANRQFSLSQFRRTFPRRDHTVVERHADALLQAGFPE